MNDLIIRKAAIEYFQRIIDATNTDGRYNLGFIDGLEFCINHLSTMPSVQPEQKKGKWIECERVEYTQFHPDYSSFYSTFRCTSCLKANYRKEKYCPNCGAKMEGEQTWVI